MEFKMEFSYRTRNICIIHNDMLVYRYYIKPTLQLYYYSTVIHTRDVTFTEITNGGGIWVVFSRQIQFNEVVRMVLIYYYYKIGSNKHGSSSCVRVRVYASDNFSKCFSKNFLCLIKIFLKARVKRIRLNRPFLTAL